MNGVNDLKNHRKSQEKPCGGSLVADRTIPLEGGCSTRATLAVR